MRIGTQLCLDPKLRRLIEINVFAHVLMHKIAKPIFLCIGCTLLTQLSTEKMSVIKAISQHNGIHKIAKPIFLCIECALLTQLINVGAVRNPTMVGPI